MAKVVCVLYDDPVTGYPKTYARDDLPKLDGYPDGQTLPTPKAIDFQPGALLGSVSGELGLRKFLESNGHQLVVTSSKDGADSVLDRELPDAEIVISQPFWPAYMTAERMAKAPKLKMIVTAGIGSDHTDLQAAMDRGITVAEVTYCNSNSVAEHVLMMILSQVRNYIPSYQWVTRGGWNIADCVERSYDLEGMQVGTVAAGRIGLRVLRLLKPFGVHLHYLDRHRLPEAVEKELNLTHHSSLESLAKVCDVVTLNCPLHPETEHMINEQSLKHFKRGLSDQYGPRQALRPRRHRPCPREWPTGGLCRRCLVPAAGAVRSSVADHAPPRHDAAHLGHQPVGADALRRRYARDPRVLLRQAPDPR